jgi:hypothetical protein
MVIGIFDIIGIICLILFYVVTYLKPKFQTKIILKFFIKKFSRKVDFISLIVVTLSFGSIVLSDLIFTHFNKSHPLVIYFFVGLVFSVIYTIHKKRFNKFGLMLTSISLIFLSFSLFYLSFKEIGKFLQSIGFYYTGGFILGILFMFLFAAWVFPLFILINERRKNISLEDHKYFEEYIVDDYPSNKRIIVAIFFTILLIYIFSLIGFSELVMSAQVLFCVSLIDYFLIRYVQN